jgi:hypothetical protein
MQDHHRNMTAAASLSSPTTHRRQHQVSLFHHDRSQLLDDNKRRKNQIRQSNNTALEAAGIQQSLSRTQALLQNELERISHVASAIQHDDKLLKETTNLHKTMNITGAKKALTALERAQQREQRILMLSVAFFWLYFMLHGNES